MKKKVDKKQQIINLFPVHFMCMTTVHLHPFIRLGEKGWWIMGNDDDGEQKCVWKKISLFKKNGWWKWQWKRCVGNNKRNNGWKLRNCTKKKKVQFHGLQSQQPLLWKMMKMCGNLKKKKTHHYEKRFYGKRFCWKRFCQRTMGEEKFYEYYYYENCCVKSCDGKR